MCRLAEFVDKCYTCCLLREMKIAREYQSACRKPKMSLKDVDALLRRSS